jgi:hypothetical protein
MIDEPTIVSSERLRDELTDFRSTLRGRYGSGSQVTSEELRRAIAAMAQKWLVEFGTNDEIKVTLGDPIFADLNVHFQRLLTFSEHATKRSKYDAELRSILNNYSTTVIVPLKQMRGKDAIPKNGTARAALENSIFVGQSFDPNDADVNNCICDTFSALGLAVATGDRPRANRISDKVKRLIEQQSIFAGIFTRRDKIARKQEWTTSVWVIDEKAYAVGLQKRLILLKEQGVNSIGGIQGDYEYIEFSREALGSVIISLIKLFDLRNNGLLK